MAHANNGDFDRTHRENHAIIANAKTGESEPLSGKRLDVTLAGFSVSSQRRENPFCDFAVYPA
jgi:hypothetical protein